MMGGVTGIISLRRLAHAFQLLLWAWVFSAPSVPTCAQETPIQQTAPPTPEASELTARLSDGLNFESADKNWVLHLGGRYLGHVREVFGEPKDSGYSTRQALLQFDAEGWKKVSFRITGDFTPVSGVPSVRIKDLYIDWTPDPTFNLRIGQAKVPVGIERTMSLLFIEGVERPIPATFQPAEEIALIASGIFDDGRFSWKAAISDGRHDIVNPPTTADSEISLDARTGRTTAKYYLRGAVRLFPGSTDPALQGIELAAFGSTSFVSGIDLYDGFRIKSPELAEYWLVPAPQEGQLFFNGRRILAGVDPSWTAGSFSLRGEYLFRRDRVDRPSTGATTNMDTHSWSGEISWMLTGETKAPGERIPPLETIDPNAGKWGSLDVFARIAGAHVDRDALETLGADLTLYSNRFTAYTIGANWWPTHNLRMSLDFVLEDYHHSITLTGSGDTARSSRGVLLRFQVDF